VPYLDLFCIWQIAFSLQNRKIPGTMQSGSGKLNNIIGGFAFEGATSALNRYNQNLGGLMRTGFVEVTLKTGVDAGELLALLCDAGALGSWEENGILHIFWPAEKWKESLVEDIRQAMNFLGVWESDAGLAISPVQDQDWNATWAASLQPIRLGQRVRIRQSWHPIDETFNGIELVIDPKRAFGTGHHATTRLIVEWLETSVRGGERILDIGTGSGILAMLALRMGAAAALAIDIDPEAIECAREYAETNGFAAELDLRTASFETLYSDKFDMIVANLDGRTLPRLSAYLPLLLKANGIGCLSGLQRHDYDEVSECLSRDGIRIRATLQGDDWLALEIQLADT
jgi:ribosomal protein L11 methyltransferase